MNTTLHTPATATLRNIGIAAHIDAGKTTLTERMLLHAGAIHSAGDVHDGTTIMDFDSLERQKGITISAAAIPCDWTPLQDAGIARLFAGSKHRINIIDTPGHVDFTAEVERSLRVLDGAVAVFCGVAGVQPQSDTVWRQADRYGVPRLAVINKMDRSGADFMRVVTDIRERLGSNAWPVVAPLGSEDSLRGQIDVINRRAFMFARESQGAYTIGDIPSDEEDHARWLRGELVERIANLDDTVADLWLNGQDVPADVLKTAVRLATIAGRFVPVLGGSAYRYKGVPALLDAVVEYLPGPPDRAGLRSHEGSELSADPEGSLAALAFKMVHDPQAGRLVFVRVFQGTLAKGTTVLNPRTGKEERIGRLVRMRADRREEIASAPAGEICAVVGLRGFATGDTLCALSKRVQLEPPVFPDPVLSLAVEPCSGGDRDRLATALARVAEEDPTFRYHTHPETGQTLIAGMGELHLEIIRMKLERDHHVGTQAGAPEIAYRETITREATADHVLKKQNGGTGMFARVILRVSPLAVDSGVVIENRVGGGTIPAQFTNAVKRGIEEALTTGVVRGSPVVDVRVEVLDGASHSKDSNEIAFRLAAAEAAREALRHAGPTLLEPFMSVEVSTPVEHQGDILGDLGRRRGRVLGLEAHAQGCVVRVEVPLAEMFGYAGAIRSLTKGRAAYAMSPARFEPVPAPLAA